MRKLNKKGFTIVELVIVIAVIAILAAVLIPTFASIINKANLSADQQAVTTINNQIAMATADGTEVESLADLIIALRKFDVDVEDYKPLTADHYFYLVKSAKKVVLADKDKNVVFPQDSGITYTAGDWSSLAGDVVTADTWTVTDTTANVSSGAELVDFMQAHNAGESEASGVTELNLTGTIDMMGADVALYEVTGDFKISGDATIMNVRSEESDYVSEYYDADYNYAIGGLFGAIGDAGTAHVTVEGITIDGASIGDIQNGDRLNKQAGLIAGSVLNESTLTIKDVTVKNSTVISMDKTGALVGYVADGTVNIEGVTVESSKVIGHHYTAKLIGATTTNSTVNLIGDGVINADVAVSHIPNDLLPEQDSSRMCEVNGNQYYYNNGWEFYMAGVTQDYWWLGGRSQDPAYVDQPNKYIEGLADAPVYVQDSSSEAIG